MKEENIAQIRYELQARIDVLEREKGTLNTKMNLLETQFASAPSQALVDSMKRELRILKRLEYNAHDTDYTNVTKDPERTGDHYHDQDDSHNNIDGGDDLESVLIAKLRRVESELVTERTSKNELIQQISTLQKELNDVMVLKEDADKLIISLEKDLERAIHASSSTNPSTKNKSSSTNPLMILPSQNNNAEKTLQSILDPNATPQQQPSPPDPPMVVTAPQAVQSSSSSLDDNSNNNNEHSVATIVMAQRDRLRIRCETLEAERDSFKRELQSQSQTSESLKLDNTKLYEKVRYLQNFNNNKSNKSVSGMYNRSTTNSDIRDLDLEALEQRYEASVDPFKQFNKSERQRKLNEMSPMERTVYIVAKTVLGK